MLYHAVTFLVGSSSAASAVSGGNTKIELLIAGVGAFAAAVSAIAGLVAVITRKRDRIVIVTPEQAEKLANGEKTVTLKRRRR